MSRCRKKNKPATQAQRDAMTFEGVPISFHQSNDEWARSVLPDVRIAACLLRYDHAELKEVMAQIVKKGAAPDILESMSKTRKHLKGLAKMLDTAMSRSFVTLERLGYDPVTNPPPDEPQPALH